MPRLVNWNIARHAPESKQARSLLSEVKRLDPDIACFTEAHATSFESMDGHIISAMGKLWTGGKPDERKVYLFSRHKWHDVEIPTGLNAIGGLVSGETTFAGQRYWVIGVCIPYHMAGRGSVGFRLWKQHEQFVAGLATYLTERRFSLPTIIIGDFNRKIPRQWGGEQSYRFLIDSLEGYAVHTTGPITPLDKYTVDHIATSSELECSGVQALPATNAEGLRRSDHFGVVAEFK